MRHLAVLSLSLGVVVGSAGIAEASYSTWGIGYGYWNAPTLASTASGCDDCAQTVNLPFWFSYWGRSFNQISVSSNGTATFGANTSAPYSNGALGANGSYALPGPTIAVLWDDWNPGAMGDVYTGSVGGAFVVEWRGLYRYGQSSGTTSSFELKLWPDGHFETHYAALDAAVTATVGMQEDVDTIAQEISVNTAVGNWTARTFYRPGNVALYTNLKDGFYTPNRPRPGLRYGQSVQCSDGNWPYLDVTSGAGEWSYAATGCGGSLWPNTMFYGDVNGYDVATIPLSPVTDVVHGTYHFIKRADFTPAPTHVRRDSIYYANTNVWGTSKLDYWRSGSSYDKTTVLVTGFDPLNTSSTAQYLVLLGDLARTMLAEGRDLAIGKFADGNQRLTSFPAEVGTWVSDAYSRQGSKVQVAGVSMGGVLVRAAVAQNVASIQSKIAAWYSVDAPQTGANLGRGDRGIQNLILCNKDASDPQYRQIFSNAAADMMNLRVASCSCSWEPENSTCSIDTSYHDGYYNNVGWPTAVPRYALAFGDANASGGYNKQGSGTLFDFTYTGWFCSEDRDWNGGQRDCNAGSRYLTPADVDTDKDASACGTFRLRLKYQPSFINTDSALGVTTSLWSNSEDGGCYSGYPTLSPTYWNGWASNDYNESHMVLSGGLKNQFMTWNRSHDPPPPPVEQYPYTPMD
jgi:hypothetical protein